MTRKEWDNYWSQYTDHIYDCYGSFDCDYLEYDTYFGPTFESKKGKFEPDDLLDTIEFIGRL